MKHLITGETVNTKTKDTFVNTIEQNDMIKNIESLKIISIGANKYLVLCTLDYLDTAQDSDVVMNSELKNKIFGILRNYKFTLILLDLKLLYGIK